MFLFFKQKTAYEMRISDWSSDVCSSDLELAEARVAFDRVAEQVNALVHLPRQFELGAGHVPVGRHQPDRLEPPFLQPAGGFLRVGAGVDRLDRKSVV